MRYVAEHDIGPQCRTHVRNEEGRQCFLQDGTPRLMLPRSALLEPLSYMPEDDWQDLRGLLTRIAVALEQLNGRLAQRRPIPASEPEAVDLLKQYGPDG